MDATDATSNATLIHELTDDGALSCSVFLEGDVCREGDIFEYATALNAASDFDDLGGVSFCFVCR